MTIATNQEIEDVDRSARSVLEASQAKTPLSIGVHAIELPCRIGEEALNGHSGAVPAFKAETFYRAIQISKTLRE